MFNLTNKTAIITGSTGGIGKSIAKVLHACGATVLLTGTNDRNLQSLKLELKDRAHSLVCNLNDLNQAESLIENANQILGRIDIVVCNAGITRDNLALRMKTEEFQQVIDINLTANFILNKSAIKFMIKNKWGRIINISSIVGITGNFGQANYTASKAGLIAMSKSIALEVASRNITVNCIAPGFIETAMTEVLKDEQKQILVNRIPSGKLGKPDDVASAALFLASEEASYITGQTIHVNGGMLMV